MTQNVTLRDAERFVGRRYVEGEYDCAALAVDVQAALFGRTVILPGHRPQGRRGQAAAIDRGLETYSQRVEQPVTGCGVLMWGSVPGLDSSDPMNRRWHIGTVFVHGGQVWVLHHMNEKHGAMLQLQSQLQQHGLHIEEYRSWI